MTVLFGIYGFISGTIWSMIFAVAERRRTWQSLSTGRTAIWGALGGCAVPAGLLASHFYAGHAEMWHQMLPMIVVTAWLGAGCAAATVSIARRAWLTRAEHSPRNAPVG